MTRAIAHPNIALVKYWGKQEKPGNLPATPNLSITLDSLTTQTSIDDHECDEIWLNNVHVQDAKISAFLNMLREQFDISPIKIVSENNFPTSAGLASSASGFAALMTAINQHANLGMNAELMSQWARQGSASAARSMFGGFVALLPPVWCAQNIAPLSHWPLETVVAITNKQVKAVASSQGMEQSRLTSPFYQTWVSSSGDDYANATQAINEKDFEQLAVVAELSCLKMHSVMLTSHPTLAYWNSATVECMQVIRQLRDQGTAVFFTVDAGPQVKAICLPSARMTVQCALDKIPNVLETICCAMGEGARIVP